MLRLFYPEMTDGRSWSTSNWWASRCYPRCIACDRCGSREASGGREGFSGNLKEVVLTLNGQVALITGAGRGIGKAIALTFAHNGARIAVTGRTQESRERVAAEIVATGGEARPFELDVTQDNEVVKAVAEVLSAWGRIDILVNNAGIIQYDSPVWAATVEEWDAMMAVNLRGIFLCCRAVAPHMMERNRGVIINIGSSSGRMADHEYGPYTATKWGVVGYTVSLARSLRPHGIRVNGINPGLGGHRHVQGH